MIIEIDIKNNQLIWIASLLLITLAGCKARQLKTPTPQMDIEPRFWVRVLLLDNVTACTLRTASPLSVTNEEPNPQTPTTGARFDQIDARIDLRLINRIITIAGRPCTNKSAMILPDEPHILSLNGSGYRGKFRLIVNSDGNSFDVINLVPIEAYLAGVVGAEMPSYWEIEALKAQAIAARTYCLYIKEQFGPNRDWDMRKTAAHQVYRGVGAESVQIWNAVNQTKGQVLVCKQNDGTESMFPAYYSSTCGGHTEYSKNVFGDSFEPLTGVDCPYCKDVAKPRFFFWPMIQFDMDDVTAKLLQTFPSLKLLGEITDIRPARQSNYREFSRLTNIELLGSTGKSDFVRAEDLRLAIDPTGRKLRSTVCKIIKSGNKWKFLSGRGWGHGVGMCQYGAEGMARGGKTAEQILLHYYPGSKISTLDY